jgi:hypothetical protein
MKKYLPLLAAGVFAAALSFAGPITTWVTGDVITANDITANFTHLHATMVGGHGPRLVNADVNASAAIAHSKLATPALLPKVWGLVPICSSSPCTVSADNGISTVTRSDAGVYTVNLDVTRANAVYATIVTSIDSTPYKTCAVTHYTTSSIGVGCVDHVIDGGVVAPVDDGFSILLLDDNN